MEQPEHRQPETVIYYTLDCLAQARRRVESLPTGTAMLSCEDTPEAAEREAAGLEPQG